MKKFLLSAFSALLTVTAVDAQTVQRTPFVEHFTQASCGPCASQNPIMYNTLNTFGTANYVKMTYQTSWPGVDPMNAAYPEGPQARVTYYGVSGVPNATLNGGATGGPNTAVTASTLSAAAAQTTPYDIKVTQTWNAGAFDVRVAVINVSGAAISSMDRLHVGMVENQITYSSAPGSNGETDFFYVLRQFYDAATGMESNAATTIGAIPATDSLVYTFSVSDYPSYVNDLEKVSFVAFLQNNSTKVVEQAGKSSPSTIPGLLFASAAANSTAGNGYCDYSFTPAVNFTSNSATPITSVTAEYSINGATPVPVTVNGINLAMGQSTPINFPATSLGSGVSNVEYMITDINNGGVYSPGPLQIAAEDYSKLNTTATAAPLTETMENAVLPAGSVFTRDLTTAIFDAPGIALNRFAVLDGPAANIGQVGGNAASNRSIYVNFYNVTSGVMNLTFHKLNFAGGSQLTFDHAYAQYQAENDRLEVQVSTDCGATWSSVFNEAGATLATVPAQTGNFVPNAANQWEANTVDLSAYDNMNDVVVRFKATSAYGNNLLLDNINFSQATNVTTVQKEAAEVRIMPNPVSNNMTLEFTMLNTADANINIVNALGQTVQQVTNGSFSGTNVIEVNTTDLASGVYFVNITTKEGTTVERFVRQ